MITHGIIWWDISLVQVIQVIQVMQLIQLMQVRLADLWLSSYFVLYPFRIIPWLATPKFLLVCFSGTPTPVLRSDSRSIVAIKLTIQTPPTFSFHPLYPRSCQHRNNNNSNYFPFVKFHICLCLWMGSLLGLFRFLLHFLFGFTLCIRCFLSQSSLLFLCWRIFSPESLIFLDCFLATYVVQCKVSQKSGKFDAT